MTASCAGDPEPLWDGSVDGESPKERRKRHEKAISICNSCPEIQRCESTIQPGDEGVRAGRILPHIRDSHRPTPYAEDSEASVFFHRIKAEAVLKRLGRPARPGPVLTDKCGTYAGYHRHKTHGQEACQPCKDARNAYEREKTRRKRSAA